MSTYGSVRAVGSGSRVRKQKVLCPMVAGVALGVSIGLFSSTEIRRSAVVRVFCDLVT